MAEIVFPPVQEITLRHKIDKCLKHIVLGRSHGEVNRRKDLVFLQNGLYALDIWTSATVQEYLTVGKGRRQLFFEMVQERVEESEELDVQIDHIKINECSIEFQTSGIFIRVVHVESRDLVSQWLDRGCFDLEALQNSHLLEYEEAALQTSIDIQHLKTSQHYVPGRLRAHRVIRAWAAQRGILHEELGYGEFQLVLAISEALATAELKDKERIEALQSYTALQTDTTDSEYTMVYVAIWAFFEYQTQPNGIGHLYSHEVSSMSKECHRSEQLWASKYKQFNEEWCLAFVTEWRAFVASVKDGKQSGFVDFASAYPTYLKFSVEYFGSSAARSLQLLKAMSSALSAPSVQASLQGFRIWLNAVGDPTSGAAIYIGTGQPTSAIESLVPSVCEAYRILAGEGASSAVADYFVALEPIQVDDMLVEFKKPHLEQPEPSAHSAPIGVEQGKGKARGMRPAIDVMNRIKWDKAFNEDEYLIGYEDRHEGIKEIGIAAWQSEETAEDYIPLHRIRHVRHRDRHDHIWNRKEGIDLVFKSARAY